MKNQLKLILAFLCLSASVSIAQTTDYTPPSNVKLKKAGDYAKYEAEILKCITWLEETPVNEKVQQHKEANAFFISWISGAPNVTVTIYPFVNKFSEVYTQYLVTFLGGGTKLILENKSKKFTDEEIQLAGLNAVINQYKANPETKRDKLLDQLSGMSNEELLTWLKEQIAKK